MHFLLGKELALYQDPSESDRVAKRNFIWRWHMRFERKFERMQHYYKQLLEWCIDHASITLLLFGLLVVISLPLTLFIGRDFFPYVDSGQMRLEVEPPQGLRIEDAEQYFARVDAEIRRVLPPGRVNMLLDNIGVPSSGINLAFSSAPPISNSDWRDSDCSESGLEADRGVHADPARRSAQEVSRWNVLLRAGEHHESDSGLRPARADRCAGDRARQGQLCTRGQAGEGDRGDSGRCGCAPASAGGLSDA